MRGLAIAVVLASRVASADTATLTFADGDGLKQWKADVPDGSAIVNGELVQRRKQTYTRAVPLDVTGWALEWKLALPKNSVGVEVVATDDRVATRVARTRNIVMLDGDAVQMDDDDLVHTYRLEMASGRRLLLVDGNVVLDHDYPLPTLLVAVEPAIAFGVTGPNPPVDVPLARWVSLSVDTAPKGLAISSRPYLPATRFTGPYASWLYRLASRNPNLAAQLAALQLPEKARACIAFSIVAAGATPRPKHLRAGELAKLPKGGDARFIEPQIDFELLESPKPKRVSKRPMMRRRVPAEIRAQAELANALKAHDPKPSYDKAVQLITDEGRLPPEAMQWLMTTLPEVAQHPDACR